MENELYGKTKRKGGWETFFSDWKPSMGSCRDPPTSIPMLSGVIFSLVGNGFDFDLHVDK